MNMALWLERAARRWPNAPALMLGGDVIADYAEFWRRACGFAGGLRARGLGPGTQIAIVLKNQPDYLVALYGIWIAGAAAVPINAKLHPSEVATILADAQASLALVGPDLLRAMPTLSECPFVEAPSAEFDSLCAQPAALPAGRSGGDLAWLFYTSGTTGQPKGVMITHGMLCSMSLNYLADVDDVFQEDGAYYAAPMSHGAGLYALVHVLKGARHICPISGGFDANELLDCAQSLGALSLFMAPTMVQRLTKTAVEAGDRGDGIRTVVYGGGPMYRSDIEAALAWFGPKFVQIYGQGECPMTITALTRAEIADHTHPNWAARLTSVGRAQSGVEVQIVSPEGAPRRAGEVGEITVRGAPVMPGYWRRPDATKDTLKAGWLFTGDLGRLDEDGYLTLEGRSKDVIISGGSNVYPREVEDALLSHPEVREVSVVGRPSAEWGEEIVAFVVGQPGLAQAALEAHLLTQIARFKRPKAFVFTEALPKNNYGKVLKTELRARLKEMKK